MCGLSPRGRASLLRDAALCDVRAREGAENAHAMMRVLPPRIAPAVELVMKFMQVDRLADHVVLPGLASVVAQGYRNTAEVLA